MKLFNKFFTSRVYKTLFNTSISYLFLTVTPYFLITQKLPSEIKILAIYESSIVIIFGLVSLGLVQDASRNIALNPNSWRKYFLKCQSFRFLIGICIASISFLIFIFERNPKILLGTIALPISLSGEYALYAKGKSIEASKSILIKNAINYSLLAFSVLNKSIMFEYIIIFSSFISFTISGFYASILLSVPYFPKIIKIKKDYLKEITIIALFLLVYNNFKNSFILLFGNHLQENDYVYYYEVFKLLYLGFLIRRSLVQIFYNQIINNVRSYRYDLIVFFCLMILNLVIITGSFVINYKYPNISILNPQVVRDSIILICSISILPTSYTKLFSLSNDNLLAIPFMIILALILIGTYILNSYQQPINLYLYLLAFTELSICISSYMLLRAYYSKQNYS